jgi:hypothetical protein
MLDAQRYEHRNRHLVFNADNFSFHSQYSFQRSKNSRNR